MLGHECNLFLLRCLLDQKARKVWARHSVAAIVGKVVRPIFFFGGVGGGGGSGS